MALDISLEVFNSILPAKVSLLVYFVAIVVVCLRKSFFQSFDYFSPR